MPTGQTEPTPLHAFEQNPRDSCVLVTGRSTTLGAGGGHPAPLGREQTVSLRRGRRQNSQLNCSAIGQLRQAGTRHNDRQFLGALDCRETTCGIGKLIEALLPLTSAPRASLFPFSSIRLAGAVSARMPGYCRPCAASFSVPGY